jgi:ankyrin repeat protein
VCVRQRDNGGNSALLLATAVGNKKIVKHLLVTSAAVDVDQKNGKGYTALVTAIQDNYKVRAMADLRGNLPVAALLIEHGADVNLEGMCGRPHGW